MALGLRLALAGFAFSGIAGDLFLTYFFLSITLRILLLVLSIGNDLGISVRILIACLSTRSYAKCEGEADDAY